ncbi:cytochrome P450 [Sphaerisporangium perillae]|uniref:cytochrome P450 n=1 Tax=Sphaerisporangium perillae TaxID=2935860 RepID=UPI0020101FC1|nr:cytochrome P450 [Sphaerisporangium perillae]
MPVEPLLTRDYDANPALVHERLRRTYGPVAPVDLLGMPVWLVIGYGEVLRVLQNEGDIWSKRLDNWRARMEGRVSPDWPLAPVYETGNSMFQDGTRLGRLREGWTSALMPFQEPARPEAQMLERAITRYADDLISALVEGGATSGWADLSAQYARPLPAMIANRLLGLESARGDEVLMDIWRVLDAGPEASAASQRLITAMTDLAATKMRHPGDDLPSYMLAAVPDLTLEELSREILMLPRLIGDFTGALICNAVLEVLTDPNVRAILSRGTIDELVNRVALANSPMANLTFRFPTVDVRLGRFVIAAGDPVMLSIPGAHADPVFAGAIDPKAMRSTRAHLAWGAGPHRCPGRQLSIRITTIAVSRLFERLSQVRLTLPPDQLPWRSTPLFRTLRMLPVQFELAPSHLPPRNVGPAPVGAHAARTPAGEQEEAPRSALSRFLRGLRKER